jgi:hypothetical protein
MTMSSELETPTVSCLRCGATYPEGAVVCFRCGAPIGDISIPTQPVRRSQALPPSPPNRAATFTQDNDNGYLSDNDVDVAALQRREQDRVPTQPRLRAQRPIVVKRQALTPVERWEQRGRVAFAIFLTLLIAAAIGGAAMGVRALLAGPPVQHQTIYQDPQHRFRFQRPALWTATPSPEGVLLSDSAGTSTAHVTVSTPGGGETAESRAAAIATVENLSIAAPEHHAGIDWQVAVGEATGRDGAVREVHVYVTEHGSLLYIIELSSPVSSFDGIDNLVYQPLLDSFAFA